MNQHEQQLKIENELIKLELEKAIYNETIRRAEEELQRHANGQNPQ